MTRKRKQRRDRRCVFVSLKTQQAQLDVQSVHCARDRLVTTRPRLIKQIRAILLERGMIIRIGERRFGKSSRSSCQPMLRSAHAWSDLFRTLRDEWAELDRRMKAYDDELLQMAREDERARRLTTIPGIGVIHATALIAAIGDAYAFAGGRDLAVWLGLSRAALDQWEDEDAWHIQARQPILTHIAHLRRASGTWAPISNRRSECGFEACETGLIQLWSPWRSPPQSWPASFGLRCATDERMSPHTREHAHKGR